MRAKDIRIGVEYLTIVGGREVKVWVSRRVDPPSWARSQTQRFACVRSDNGRDLPKPRTAAALRPYTPEDRASEAVRAAKRAAKPPRPPRRMMPSELVGSIHVMVRCRDVATKARTHFDAAWTPRGSTAKHRAAFIRQAIRTHLANRAQYLSIRDCLAIDTAARMALLSERLGRTVSADDMANRPHAGTWRGRNDRGDSSERCAARSEVRHELHS